MKPAFSIQHLGVLHPTTLFNSPRIRTLGLQLVSLLSFALLSGCNLGGDAFSATVQHRIEHSINYRIARAKEYSEPIYDQTRASLTLTLSLEDLGNGRNTVIWDTTFSMRSIREFPAPNTPLVFQKDIKRNVNPNEVLRISQSLQFRDRDNTVWSEAKGEIIPRDIRFKQLDITL
ncbi:hypothetical protein ACFPIK_16220 [Algoriphagus aquatilis]|uniref:LPS export ABC transporter periplasmic protein LptC n=1 Tax=Algoriphagus aquatilis TaxID=490186 RepID=A0ABW0C240_9BACT